MRVSNCMLHDAKSCCILYAARSCRVRFPLYSSEVGEIKEGFHEQTEFEFCTLDFEEQLADFADLFGVHPGVLTHSPTTQDGGNLGKRSIKPIARVMFEPTDTYGNLKFAANPIGSVPYIRIASPCGDLPVREVDTIEMDPCSGLPYCDIHNASVEWRARFEGKTNPAEYPKLEKLKWRTSSEELLRWEEDDHEAMDADSNPIVIPRNLKQCKRMVQQLSVFMVKHWQLPEPRFLLDVVGGSGNFKLPARIEEAVQEGIYETALETKAWVLTSALDTGAGKLIADGMHQYDTYHDVPTIGIATWGTVTSRHLLVRRSETGKNYLYLRNTDRPVELEQLPEVKYRAEEENSETSVELNPFITHLILVDDGSEGQFGREAGLRSMLPQTIRGPSSIPGGYGAPCVCVVIQGEARVLSVILRHLENSTPCVIVKGSGGVADLLLEAWELRWNLETEFITSAFKHFRNAAVEDFESLMPKYIEWRAGFHRHKDITRLINESPQPSQRSQRSKADPSLDPNDGDDAADSPDKAETIIDAITSRLSGVVSLVRIWKSMARDQHQIKAVLGKVHLAQCKRV